MTIRILLVDDHPIVRQGLKTLLEGHSGWEVIGEASDGAEAVELAVNERAELLLIAGWVALRRREREHATTLALEAAAEAARRRRGVARAPCPLLRRARYGVARGGARGHGHCRTADDRAGSR